MRDLRTLDHCRQRAAEMKCYGQIGGSGDGIFLIPSKIDRAMLRVIASSGFGWDHVLVSRVNRCPNWLEMCQVKELFFLEDETVVQYHVPPGDHVNVHPNCLHLWRSQTEAFPRPPKWMVG